MIHVLNRHKDLARSGAIYVGRGTPFGNPFKPGTRGTPNLAVAVAQFKLHLERVMSSGPDDHELKAAMVDLLARYRDGEEIQLVCSCKPLACHADVIVEWIEEHA